MYFLCNIYICIYEYKWKTLLLAYLYFYLIPRISSFPEMKLCGRIARFQRFSTWIYILHFICLYMSIQAWYNHRVNNFEIYRTSSTSKYILYSRKKIFLMLLLLRKFNLHKDYDKTHPSVTFSFSSILKCVLHARKFVDFFPFICEFFMNTLTKLCYIRICIHYNIIKR